MKYHYTSDFNDFKKAQSCYWSSNATRRARYYFYRGGLFAIGLLIAVACYPIRAESLLRLIAMPIAAGCLAGGAILALAWPWRISRGYHACGGDLHKGRNVYIEVVDGLLISGLEGKSEARFQRSSICEVAGNGDFLLLFVAPKRFLYIPQKRLPKEAFEEIHAWLGLPHEVPQC